MTDEPAEHRATERESIPNTWRMLGAVGLSSMMAATGIFLLGGTDSSASASTNASTTTHGPKLAPVVTARTTAKMLAAHSVATKSTTSAATTSTTAHAAAACTKHYRVRAGDSWSLIASEANMSLDALLSLNHATTSTGLQPGQSLCIPANVTVVVATTAAPGTAAPAAPRTTQYVPPATAAPAPVYTPVVRSGGS
jgi:LysM repeat protein